MMMANFVRTLQLAGASAAAGLLIGAGLLSASEGQYGEALNAEGVTEVRIGELMAEPESYLGKRIRVEGLVDDVCPMKGCWIKILEQQSKSTIRFKVEDDVIVFPVEAKGHQVVAEGIFRSKELDQDAARQWFQHLADEKGENFDPASITGSVTIYEMEGLGARLGG